MGQILKVTAAWSGFIGSPGYSNFYWHEVDPGAGFDQGATSAADKVQTFFGAIKAYLPPAVKIDVQQDVSVIDETNGQLINIANAGPRTTIAGTAAAGVYSAATGMVISWRTSGVRNGRRVRGRTFVVPTSGTSLAADGTVAAAAKTAFQTAANALIAPDAARAMVVWARPSSKGATDGLQHVILSATIPSKVAVLKSRRD